MTRLVSLSVAAEAAEELASALLGFSVAKAIDPLTPAGFLQIGKLVADKLRKAAAGEEANAVKSALAELNFDWKSMTDAAANAALKAVKEAVAASYALKVMPKVEKVLAVEGPKTMKLTRAALRAQNLSIDFTVPDRDYIAEAAIRLSHTNFIRNSGGERVEAASIEARTIVADGLRRRLTTEQIASQLEKHFLNTIPRPPSYWDVVSEAFIGRARSASSITALEDASVETYQLVAVIDEVTTDICRHLDGMVFKVSDARAHIEALNVLENAEDVKYAAPWVRKGAHADGGKRLFIPHADGTTTTLAKIDRSGVGSVTDKGTYSDTKSADELAALGVLVPPFHGRCRTTLVAGPVTSGG